MNTTTPVSELEALLIPNREIAAKMTQPLPQIFGQFPLAERRLVQAILSLNVVTLIELQALFDCYHDTHNKQSFESIVAAHPNVDALTMLKLRGLQQGMNFVPLEQFRIAPSTIGLLNPTLARQYHMVPFHVQEVDEHGKKQQIVWIVTSNPNNASGKDAVRKFFAALKPHPYKVQFLVADGALIEKMVSSRYTATVVFDEAEELTAADSDDDNLGPAQEFFSRIFAKAVELGASDVHVEDDFEGTGGLQVRMRIDGVLSLVDRVEKKYKDSVLAVMKLNFGMDVAERRKPPIWSCKPSI